MRTATMLLAVVILLVAVPAWADFEAGAEAFKRSDYATALKEWRPLAEQGHAGAQVMLGVMYDYGRGVTKDYAEAIRWYRLAAEQGYAGAQYNLGFMYVMGRGVQQDHVQAYLWFNLAAAQGNELDRKVRDGLAEMMTPAQLADAQRMAREWKPEIAEERKNLSIDDVIAGFANNNLFYFEIILENGKYSKAFNKCLSSRPADFNWIKTNCKKNPELKNAFQCSEDSRFTHAWFIYESQDKCEEVREFTKDRLDALLR